MYPRTCLVNGVLHWVASCLSDDGIEARQYVITFNLSTNVFGKISLPESSCKRRHLTVISGSLAVIANEYYSHTVHVRKEYNNAAYWSLVFQLRDFPKVVENVSQVTINGDLLLYVEKEDYKAYNLKTGVCSIVGKFNASCGVDIITYGESLELLGYTDSNCYRQKICAETKIDRNTMSGFLLEELIVEILQRLPPKTVIRFRSVSKSWYNRIASPDFVHRYTLRSLKNKQKVLLRQRVPNANDVFFTKVLESKLPLRPIHRSFKGQTKLEFPIRDFKIFGSCKGILCLVDSKFKIILWNPTIRCKIIVPDHPFYRDYSEDFHIASGFGFDPITNDYKIATVSFFRGREIVEIVTRLQLPLQIMNSSHELVLLTEHCTGWQEVWESSWASLSQIKRMEEDRFDLLGGNLKRDWIKELVEKNSPSFFGIQETKSDGIAHPLIRSLWPGNEVDFVASGSVGASGGILTMWDTNVFSKESEFINRSYVGIVGSWSGMQGKVGILNVYAPQDSHLKEELWSSIELLLSNINASWIVFGDFNVVRFQEERNGSRFNSSEANSFNDFISRCGLFDFPHSQDSTERALRQVIGGPKPFKVFDKWLKVDGFSALISSSWASLSFSQPPDILLKNKLRALRLEIKKWAADHRDSENSPQR
ncbi:RNA-directed DNA polymerase, eukaryota [Tanacetum coccineum]